MVVISPLAKGRGILAIFFTMPLTLIELTVIKNRRCASFLSNIKYTTAIITTISVSSPSIVINSKRKLKKSLRKPSRSFKNSISPVNIFVIHFYVVI